MLDQADLITDTACWRALCARIRAREAQDLSLTTLWFNHTIVGLSAEVAGFVPVAAGWGRPQEMRLLP